MNKLIEWFADNPVAANLLMVAILIGGTFSYLKQVDRQFFPSVASSSVGVTVNYLGAGPEEVEERILIRVEEAIQDLEGIKKINATANEGFGQVVVEVAAGYDTRVLLDDVKARVDGINTFPAEAERPVVAEFANGRQQREMLLAISGNMSERTLKSWAERLRDDIGALANIDKADLQAVRDYEVSIEVPEASLRRYGLTLGDVQRAVADNSLNLPAGNIKSDLGDITLRTRGQAYNKADFEELVVLQQPDGTVIRIKDIGVVNDGFVEEDLRARLSGNPAIILNVVSVSNPDVTRTSRIVREYLEDVGPQLPEGLNVTVLDDASITFNDRMSMLLNNGISGLLLVFIVLLLFLRPAVAIWVAIGIGISFFGAIWALPWFGISLNMISLFAFLLVLGIVVDDAIIVGEAIHTRHERGLRGLEAASRGATRVATPVFLAVLSTLIFFAPMFGVPGDWRDVAMNVPVVVFAALLFSLIESLLILPAHLKDMKPLSKERKRSSFKPLQMVFDFMHGFTQFQQRFADWMKKVIQTRYRPIIERALQWRTVTVLSFVLVFAICIGTVGGGWLRVAFFPSIVADFVAVTIDLPENAPFSRTADIQDRLETAAAEANQSMENDGYTPMSLILSFAFGSSIESFAFTAEDEVEGVDAKEFSKRWRENLGPVPEAEEIRYTTSLQEAQKPIDIQVSGGNIAELELAIEAIKSALASYGGVYDIKDTLSDPQPEIVMNLRPQAQSLALGLTDLALQIRQGYYGAEAQRIPRGKDDVRVMVRYPRAAREDIESLSNTRIRVGDGIEIPFDSVAETQFGTGAVSIEREDRKRVGHVTADALASVDPNQVLSDVLKENQAKWAQQFPRTEIKAAGETEEQNEFIGALAYFLIISVFVIYAILAVSFRSYGIPVIILTAIPFGFSGAVIGHMIMGMSLSMFSLLGIIAAAGVVVNDNLVLLDHLGRLRKEGMKVTEAIIEAACDRFRAIILTSLTTFIGLAPLMAETSTQAQLLIPMVVSLAFGVLFATGVTLILVPCLYSLLWDIKHRVLGFARSLFAAEEDTSGLSTPAE